MDLNTLPHRACLIHLLLSKLHIFPFAVCISGGVVWHQHVRQITKELILPEVTGRDYNFKWCSVALQDRFKKLEKKKKSGEKKRVNKTWFKSLEGVSISLVTSQVTHVWPTSNQLQLIASYANLILLSVIWNCQQNQICIICHKAQHPSLDNTWWPKRRERCFSHWLTINITVHFLCLKYGCGDLWLWNEQINETGGN